MERLQLSWVLVLGCAIRRDLNMLKLGQTCLRIAWRLRTNIKCFREVSMIIFLDILKTDSVRHAGEVLKTMRIHKMPRLPQTKGNVWKRLGFLKKHFMFLQELNRRIHENGINLTLPCTERSTFSKHFPAAWSLPQNTAYFAFFPDFSHLFSDSDHFFRDPWVPLTFFPAATLVVYHFRINLREEKQCFD